MRIEIDKDETWALLSFFVQKIADEVELPDGERAKIRKWRSDVMKPSSETGRILTAKVNEDLERAASAKERSAIQKPDWR